MRDSQHEINYSLQRWQTQAVNWAVDSIWGIKKSSGSVQDKSGNISGWWNVTPGAGWGKIKGL